jgi:hypothetical protein
MQRLFVLLAAFLLVAVPGQATETPTDPAAIRAEMIKIRRATNWNDPTAVEKANERIRQLTAQLEANRLKQEAAKAGASAEQAAEAVESSVLNRATVQEKVEKSAAKSRGGGIDLAEDVRLQIVEEYEEDRNPLVKNPVLFDELRVLVIDFSLPRAQERAEQLDRFKAIDTLILKGAGPGAPVNLEAILGKARHLPLTALYIFNFQAALSAMPETIAAFPHLNTLGLFNNNLQMLPASLGGLKELRILYLDGNPIATLKPTIAGLRSLGELGIARTRISPAETAEIATMLPQCKVLTQ